jgi:hypothetical protein
MTYKVGTFVIKRYGQVLHPVLNQGMKPGKISIVASSPAIAVGGPIPVGGAIDLQMDGRLSVLGGPTGFDPEPISPTIELVATNGDININQYIFASAITTGAVGGHIIIKSTKGKVIVGRRGHVDTNNGRSNFGGTLVDIAPVKA